MAVMVAGVNNTSDVIVPHIEIICLSLSNFIE